MFRLRSDHRRESKCLLQEKVQRPIWVRGGICIESADGTPYEVRNRVTLCRCGASANKPFCDGQHAAVGFEDGL
jgi:CDGSH-type Zn-finger protein